MANNTQRVAYNTVAQVGGRFAGGVISLFSLSMTARYLGVDRYGQLTAAVIYITLLTSLTDTGLYGILVRELAQETRPPNDIIGTGFLLSTVVAITMAAVGLVIGLLIYHGPSSSGTRQVLIILSLTIPAVTCHASLTATLVARLRNDLIVVGDVVGKLFNYAYVVWGVHHHFGLMRLTMGYVVGAVVNCAIGASFSIRKVRPRFFIDWPYWRYLVNVAIPLGAAGILSNLYLRADGFLLSLMRPNSQVAIYGIAYRFVEFIAVVPALFAATLLPLLAAAHRDLRRVNHLMLQGLRTLTLLAAPATLGAMVLSSEMVALFGGRSFSGAARPLIILLASCYFTYGNALYSYCLVAIGLQGSVSRIMGVTLLTNIMLNLLMIPLWGASGAACAVTLTELASLLMYRSVHRRAGLNNQRWREHIHPILAAGVMAGSIVLLKPIIRSEWTTNVGGLFICVVAGAAVYIALVLTTGAVKWAELRRLVNRRPRALDSSH